MVEVVEKMPLNKVENGGFITQYDGRKVLNRDVVETINAHLKRTKQNRDNIALAKLRHKAQDIFRYNAKSNGARTIWP
jgi:chromosome partitioning protein